MEDDYVRHCIVMGFVFSYITIDLFVTMEIFKYNSEFIYGTYRTVEYLQFDYDSILLVKIVLIIKSCVMLLFAMVIGLKLQPDK